MAAGHGRVGAETTLKGSVRMFHVIYNPIAGKGKAAAFRASMERRFEQEGVLAYFHDTTGPRHASAIARELTDGARDVVDIVVMGGDGSLHEVLNGIVDPKMVRLGLMPCGSGNDFAAVAGIPDTPEGAVDVLLKCPAKPTDYLECSGVRGINVIGTGIDVDILRRYARKKLLKGSAAYFASLLQSLFHYRPYRFSERVAGHAVPHSAFIACAGNGQRIGGGIPICPKAVIDDGLLDIVIVDNIKKPGIPRALIKLMKRRVLELPSTAYRRDERLSIVSDAPLPLQIDGEIYESLPFDVRVVSGALMMYRP